MGQVWENLELEKLPAYILQKKIPQTPRRIFLFGAGASFGSDGMHLYQAGQLPPLGKDLFMSLSKDSNLKTWSHLPNEVKDLFESKTFEEAMNYLDTTAKWSEESFQRDLDLFRYFSKFSPQRSNLYWKLAMLISRKLKDRSWSGAIVTLNYDRLLEESLMRNYVFTVVKGVTFYDDNLPPFNDNQLFEVCYPHGACQFFLGQNWFTGEGNVAFGPEARAEQTAGVNQILKKSNIPIACDKKQIPMICRYQSDKRPSVKNYFIDLQQERTKELFHHAESITMVGVYCSCKTDHHIWSALARSNAIIHYLEPFIESQYLFREWAEKENKKEGEDFVIKNNRFKDGFEYIKFINDLEK
ncbi:MAG: hypothetical protein WCC06_10480 [Candidatus Aminicenantales bacterium]